MKNTINNVFDQVYLLNLERDTNKLDSMKLKLEKLNIKFKVFKAIDGNQLKNCKLLRFGNKGAVGYKMSMMQIFKNAKNMNEKKILIFEDDLYFHKEFNILFDEFYSKIKQLSDPFKLIYFGASNNNLINFHDSIKQNKTLYHLKEQPIAGSYAMGYCSSIFNKILKFEKDERPLDDILSDTINEHNYIHLPYLTYADISKPSTTQFNNFKDQILYNQNNYINADNYF